MSPGRRPPFDWLPQVVLVDPDGRESTHPGSVAEHTNWPHVATIEEVMPDTLTSCRLRAGETCEHGWSCRRAESVPVPRRG